MATATKNTKKAKKTFDSLSERDQGIVNDLLAGEARAVVANKHGLTPERVRQISEPFLSDIKKSRASAREERRVKERREHLKQVKSLAEENPSMRVSAIASSVGGSVTPQDVIGVIGEKDALRRDQIRFVEDPVFTQKFTDEDCFEALREASRSVGKAEGKKDGEYGVLTMVLYSENSKPEDPKRSTIQKRFGTWQNACNLAGIPSGEPIPHRVYKKRWTHEEMVAIVQRFFTECGVFGSMRDYSEWALNVPNTPTQATVRAHFGSWTKVKEIAAQMAENKEDD